MKMPQISLLEWQKRYGTEKACAAALAKYRWPQGFLCPQCGHDSSCHIKTRKVYQCSKCRHQVSVTAGTLFHSTNLPLVKWFWAIYLTASDKGGISALRLSKHIGVSWPTARNMLKKIRTAMAHRDSIYRLFNEFAEAFLNTFECHQNWREMGLAGRNFVAENHDIPIVRSQCENIYYRVSMDL